MEIVDQARESNVEATVNLAQAKKHHNELLNEYCREEYKDLGVACAKIKTPFTSGSFFFRKEEKIPSDSTFETCTGLKLKRKPLTEYVREIVINAANDEDVATWKSYSNSNGVKVEYSTERSEPGAYLYRAKSVLKVSPRELLLTQIRSNVVGAADENICYMREHYAFVDGKSFLFHNVRKALPKVLGMEVFQLRDFFDFSNFLESEDGTIIFSSQSVNLPANIKGCTRGDNLVFGIVMKPVEVEEGEETVVHTEATLITQFRANGLAPGKLVDAFTPRGIGAYLKNVEAAAIKLREDGETERLIKRYIEHEEEPLD